MAEPFSPAPLFLVLRLLAEAAFLSAKVRRLAWYNQCKPALVLSSFIAISSGQPYPRPLSPPVSCPCRLTRWEPCRTDRHVGRGPDGRVAARVTDGRTRCADGVWCPPGQEAGSVAHGLEDAVLANRLEEGCCATARRPPPGGGVVRSYSLPPLGEGWLHRCKRQGGAPKGDRKQFNRMAAVSRPTDPLSEHPRPETARG